LPCWVTSAPRLLVDSVSDIVEIDADNISRADQGEAWSSGLIDGIATVGEQLVPLLALRKLTGNRLPALVEAA
jgi:chemotaxis signal transduction protein